MKMNLTTPEFRLLGWVGNHFVAVLDQISFKGGCLNIWLEYPNIDEGFIRRHIEGFFSGFSLVDIRNRENGMDGSNLIYRIDTEHHTVIPGIDAGPEDSVIGVMDCDFSCMMIVSFRPSPDTTDGMVELYKWEI